MNAAVEGFNRNANRVMNSLVPVASNANSKGSSGWIFTLIVIAVVIAVTVAILYYFKDSLNELSTATIDMINGYFSTPPKHSPPPSMDVSGNKPLPDASTPLDVAPAPSTPSSMPELSMKNAEKILSGGFGAGASAGPSQVFNISSNKYTYYDAEPLCKALGAELATYDQVKDAWSKGADWCNYGWIKGQMAVYPTSDDSFNKLQKGPAEQHLACGRPGVNGGYFDNPELRYGVTCYGSKPSKENHDVVGAVTATPTSPDALEFDKKVAEFKLEADTIGIMPFNTNKW
jgi:hypothetical protein